MNGLRRAITLSCGVLLATAGAAEAKPKPPHNSTINGARCARRCTDKFCKSGGDKIDEACLAACYWACGDDASEPASEAAVSRAAPVAASHAPAPAAAAPAPATTAPEAAHSDTPAVPVGPAALAATDIANSVKKAPPRAIDTSNPYDQ